MERWAGKSAIVTGAASGIGRAITIALLEKKVNVLALDVQTEKLSTLKNEWNANWGTLCVMRCNISDENDLKDVFDYLENNDEKTWNGGVDVMVNNAGVIEYTRVIESDRAAFERLLNINVLATAVCINRAVRSMRQRNVEGHIFNINSVLGHEIPSGFLSEIDGCNGWNLYPTCKHGNVALTHTVRRELAAIKAPIRITSISPGIVETDIARHTPTISKTLKNIPALRPEDIADAVIYALGTRPEVQITELTIQRTGEA
ncbi:farnesol dehydrogenase-like isoform X2 [Bombus affinis]|uniref:Farnesol dehydrogenase isoform X1 n=1 Tax=Bombus terrestris TaxID=30195 RepID=A0A6P3U340_BOMTE|nr:farnesol dehydrogenase isoform X1 [Bombus terrestris]XP_012165906.1 farnesol dehydrogenase isoform X1 [Bombus terrestris]XP_012165907.1 farnesol dehydrogenase isoform X1 [Bombus terrestris]XP_048263639.1 farnesol dehydrogenase isoform X1 [Bombus terrestris]XP_050585852.1 farnesol dehydrogenase-like isoform X2 [Bombus affinis]XP_050585862.1 farnesol dehydrogenase-like isoform X2 [Bombus affinis]XP_050585872.1 farnesol dehydrogenase-like isoform X2 [Bombus affinis]XP_050585881.1 farnesol de